MALRTENAKSKLSRRRRLSRSSVSEKIAIDQKRQQLEKQIAALEKKIRREKQFNKQVEMNAELKRLKKELDNLL